VSDAWEPQLAALGALLRAQRSAAGRSLREVAALTNVSSSYLSQLERGQHEPSARVLRSLAVALDLSAETLLAQAGFVDPKEEGAPSPASSGTEEAIGSDPSLSAGQKEALLRVYRSFRAEAP
jgi:transcriptional regulator with XRE-family HTH domain